jgi:hypothetical protein
MERTTIKLNRVEMQTLRYILNEAFTSRQVRIKKAIKFGATKIVEMEMKNISTILDLRVKLKLADKDENYHFISEE